MQATDQLASQAIDDNTLAAALPEAANENALAVNDNPAKVERPELPMTAPTAPMVPQISPLAMPAIPGLTMPGDVAPVTLPAAANDEVLPAMLKQVELQIAQHYLKGKLADHWTLPVQVTPTSAIPGVTLTITPRRCSNSPDHHTDLVLAFDGPNARANPVKFHNEVLNILKHHPLLGPELAKPEARSHAEEDKGAASINVVIPHLAAHHFETLINQLAKTPGETLVPLAVLPVHEPIHAAKAHADAAAPGDATTPAPAPKPPTHVVNQTDSVAHAANTETAVASHEAAKLAARTQHHAEQAMHAAPLTTIAAPAAEHAVAAKHQQAVAQAAANENTAGREVA